MTTRSRRRWPLPSLERLVGGVHASLRLTWRGYVWLGCALGALVVALLSFAGIGEDVLGRNGQYQNDPGRLSWFVAHRDLIDVDAAKLLAIGGSVAVLLVLAVLAALVLMWRRVPLAIALAPLLALLTAGAIAGIVKSLVGRARPAASLQLGAESGASFPSGHATDTTAFLLAGALVVAIVILRRPLARAAMVVGAGLVSVATAASRLILGVHWPTDVLAGMALGTAVALATVMAALIVTRLSPRADARRTGTFTRLARWSRPQHPAGATS